LGDQITAQQRRQSQQKPDKDFFKRVILKFVGYNNPKVYWDTRWKLGLKAEKWTREAFQHEFTLIIRLMEQYNCQNILEIGCGKAHLRNLKGYRGFDYSLEALKKGKVNTFIYGDISDRKLPIPGQSFDSVMTRFVLLHIPFEEIEIAVDNICRIARKLIILKEPTSAVPKQTHFHCFAHDLPKLFKKFDGKVVFLPLEKKAGVRPQIAYLKGRIAKPKTEEKLEIVT